MVVKSSTLNVTSAAETRQNRIIHPQTIQCYGNVKQTEANWMHNYHGTFQSQY